MNKAQLETKRSFSRRKFIKSAAVVSTATVAAGNRACAAQPDRVRIGLIGCGGRGSGAVHDCMLSSENVEIYAMGDLFEDRLAECVKKFENGWGVGRKKRRALTKKELNVAADRRFTGFDAFKGVLSAEVDVVILATPPHFRPMMIRAALEAGKHVFAEKPVAVDPAGVKSVIASAALAKKKGLSLVAGAQRRHDPAYKEVIKRIQDGRLGELTGGQCYWNGSTLWLHDRKPEWSDMEYQIRNWLYYTWLSGDHIVEQHIHNLDVMNWAFGAHPVSAMGVGGREVRVQPEYGNIFDHFAVEYVYPNDARVMSMCRQMKGAARRVGEHLTGTQGRSDAHTGIEGMNPYRYAGKPVNSQVQEHADMIAGIRNGQLLNEGKRVAESTLTAIMGRMSAYTGREVSWGWVMNASKLDLTPDTYAFGDLAVAPVAAPGITPLA